MAAVVKPQSSWAICKGQSAWLEDFDNDLWVFTIKNCGSKSYINCFQICRCVMKSNLPDIIVNSEVYI